MTYGQLIDYNMKNIFLKKKAYTKCGRETSSRPISGKLRMNLSLDQWSKIFIVC